VSQGGLEYKGKSLAWDEIERIDLASLNTGGGVRRLASVNLPAGWPLWAG